jgi:16S rRNA C967 or C1407 C5-methylase (RsmB/RsmF family)
VERFHGIFARYAKYLAEMSQAKFFPSLQNVEVDGVKIQPPTSIPWYPDNLAYQYNVCRAQIRKSESFKRFHNFLTSETEIGNVSRQESVSMIPPLLLDVQPHHQVLDMCAAPGSKTAQLIEAVHGADVDGEVSDGLVVANDADGKRAYMLVHQTKRLQSPCLLVTNHEAQFFPNLFDPVTDEQFKFDRILADVPCSGDGTLRKNPVIWRDWTTNNGSGLHILQLRILMRALSLLKVGGKVVYSTCSLNPIENEAVVAAAIKRCGGSVEIVNVSDQLPQLQRRSGLQTWKVPSVKEKGKLYSKYEEVENSDKVRITPSFFPPAESVGTEHCLRILPHLQNTGGFFVAVLKKLGELDFKGKSQYGEEAIDFPVRKRSGPKKCESPAEELEDAPQAELAPGETTETNEKKRVLIDEYVPT